MTQCTTGRVYLLKFRDRPDRKYFYWMQEPKDSKDEELQKKVYRLKEEGVAFPPHSFLGE